MIITKVIIIDLLLYIVILLDELYLIQLDCNLTCQELDLLRT